MTFRQRIRLISEKYKCPNEIDFCRIYLRVRVSQWRDCLSISLNQFRRNWRKVIISNQHRFLSIFLSFQTCILLHHQIVIVDVKADLKENNKSNTSPGIFSKAIHFNQTKLMKMLNKCPFSLWFKSFRLHSIEFWLHCFHSIDRFSAHHSTNPDNVYHYLSLVQINKLVILFKSVVLATLYSIKWFIEMTRS